jgi:DNA-binding NarL/FixJ family response regulator
MPATVWWKAHIMPNSVLIVDDSHIVRKVMRSFFERRTDWKIGGEAEDGAEAIQKAKELRPDLILLDFSMPNMNGIEAASELKRLLPDTRIIVFTMFDDALGSSLSSAVGVDLVVPKAEGLTVLVSAVQHFLSDSAPVENEAKMDRRSADVEES